MAAWQLAVLTLAGGAAGLVNTLAGGGAAFTVPLLILFGVPAGAANATNRLSVLAYSASSTVGFVRAGKVDGPAVLGVCVPTAAGALIGAWAVTFVPDAVLTGVIVVTMLATAVVSVVRARFPSGAEVRRHPWAPVALFGAGLYAGFLQLGVGLVLLAILNGLLRYDLVRANALKVVIVVVSQLLAIAVFVTAGDVRWVPGLWIALGAAVGAQVGVRIALGPRGEVVVRWLVVIMTVVVVAAVLARG